MAVWMTFFRDHQPTRIALAKTQVELASRRHARHAIADEAQHDLANVGQQFVKQSFELSFTAG